MAEETPIHDRFESYGSDDMSTMRTLMHSVKGLMPTSMSPMLDSVAIDTEPLSEQFQFEQ